MAAEKFLIIHLYSNGDCLYATAIARQLKTDHPGCTVTWAVAPFCAGILANNPYIDTIWTIDYMPDRKIETFRQHRGRLWQEAEAKGFTRIFFTQILEENFSFYDGQVRSSILAAFQQPVTVPLTPVLELTAAEQERVKNFAQANQLSTEDYTILFECAPLSGQLAMDIHRAHALAVQMTAADPAIKVILSSAHQIDTGHDRIIDGSVLSLRETAGLTHHCSLLIGCSSGITWASTSTAAKPLPSVQLLDNRAYIFNSPALDHERNGLSADRWLELYDFDDAKILSVIRSIREQGFDTARKEQGQRSKQTFRIYRGITHEFIRQRKFGLLSAFIRRNRKRYGFNLSMYKSILLGIILFPVQYFLNKRKGKN